MSVTIHEREATRNQPELFVDTFEDLVGMRDDLGRLLTNQVVTLDEHAKTEIQELREKMTDKVVETLDGKHTAEQGYSFVITEESIFLEAIQIAKQAAETSEKLERAQITSSRSNYASRQIVQPRITSFFDPRLDEQPHRWLRR